MKSNPKSDSKIFKIVLAVEIILLLCLGVMLFTPKRTYTLGAGERTLTLPYGHYYISCSYDIDQDIDTVNYLYIQNKNGTTSGITQTDNYLNEENSSYSTEFWIRTPYRTVELSVRQFGENVESPSLNSISYEIKSTPYAAFIGILVLLGAVCITVTAHMIKINKIKLTRERIIYAVILFIAFIISCIPLAGDSLLRADDTMIHLIRLEGIKDGYLAGQFPVKVEPTFNGGYGYAFSTYYGSLYYNIPAFLRLMGFTIQNAYKAYVVLVNLATIIIAYYSFKIIFKRPRLALLGSLLYSLSIYRLYDLYQRGAVGEYTAMVFLPLIAAGLWRIYTTPVDDKSYKRLWIMPVIGYSGVIETHVLSTELYGAFTILLCLIMFKKTFRKQTFFVLLKVVLITAVLNIGYLLPFIESYTRENVIVNSDMLIETRLSQGLGITDVFKFFTGGNDDNVWWRTYIIGGLGPAALSVLVLFIYTLKRGIDKQYKKLMMVTGIITLFALIISLDVFPWDNMLTALYNGPTNSRTMNAVLQKISLLFINVQFRIRFMIVGVETYTLFACAVLAQRDEDSILKYAGRFIVGLTAVQFIWAGAFIMSKSERVTLNTISPDDVEITCNIGNYEYIPLREDGGMPFTNMFREPLICRTTNAVVTEFEKKYTNIYAHVVVDKDNVGLVEVPLLYYRGYKAVDVDTGKELMLYNVGSSARVGVILESGYEGNIKVYYAGKTTWHIAEAVSCIVFILIILYSHFSKKQIIKNNN